LTNELREKKVGLPRVEVWQNCRAPHERKGAAPAGKSVSMHACQQYFERLQYSKAAGSSDRKPNDHCEFKRAKQRTRHMTAGTRKNYTRKP